MPEMTFDLHGLLHSEFSAHIEIAHATKNAVGREFHRLVDMCITSLQEGGKLLVFGNGGSASGAQHFVTELTVRYQAKRPAIAAIALTTNCAELTAAGNDLGFEQVFSRQIESIGRPGDVAIGISTSGRSPNVIRALQTAKQIGCYASALTGNDGGDLLGVADPLIVVPSSVTARIQEMHAVIAHALCKAIEYRLGYG